MMLWIFAEAEANALTLGLVVLSGITLLTGVNLAVGIYQKLWPQKTGLAAYMTREHFAELRTSLDASIGSVRKKVELMEEHSKQFVTRGELFNSREALFGTLNQRIAELSQLVHENTESVHRVDSRTHDMQLKQEQDNSRLWRKLDVLQDRLKRHEQDDKEKNDASGDSPLE